MTALSSFPQWIVYQQDYFWFLVALGWGAMLAYWWRFLQPTGKTPWLPWAASTGMATAGIEISQLVYPVTVQPGVAPWQMWDMALGIANAILAAGLWWLAWRENHSHRHRLIGLGIAAGVTVFAPLRGIYPALGSWLTTGTLTAAVVVLLNRSERYREDRLSLALLVAASWCSTAGPVAEALRIPHRYCEFSPLGPWAAALQIASFLVLARKYAGARSPLSAVEPDDQIPRHYLRHQALWLLAGLLIASAMGRWARINFEKGLLSRVMLSAELIDRQALADGMDNRFHLSDLRAFTQQNGDTSYMASSDHLGRRVLLPVAQTLSRIELANPDAQWALVQTLRDGWLVASCTSTRMPGDMADVGVYGRASPKDLLEWSLKRASVDGPVELYYGSMVQARAPLFDPAGRMRGWLVLDFTPAHWLSAQVQVRLLAFSVIALGSALLLIDSLRRQQEKQSEAAARRAAIAQEANRLKGAFLANVSHELRTPIQSLLGYSELLRERMAGDPKAVAWLAAVNQNGELMTRLVNDLIDLGAIEAGAFQLSPRIMEPASLLTQTVESFRPRAEMKGLSLAWFVAGEVPAWVSLDGERFRQVLINLVGNAIKFTERGGVTVALRLHSGNQLELIVRDTGPGIPTAEQSRLFTPFFRLPLTAAKEGSGLGLALSAALCRAMGGALTLESDGLSGATFTALFSAPAAPAPAHAPESALEITGGLRGCRVLVVDDNPLVRELFVAFLTEQGASCAAACSGAEALAQVEATCFDAIILDLALPDGDGTEFVQPLKERAPAVRLIGVSAHASPADRQRALHAGMTAFLTKPVTLRSLAATVANVSTPPATGQESFQTEDALRERLGQQFRRELPGRRNRLATVIAASDWDAVASLAHYLKNSAVVVRDDALFAACTGLEEAANAADAAAVTRWWNHCETNLARWSTTSNEPLSPPAA